MSDRTAHVARASAVGFVGGLAIGLLIWNGQMRRSRRELFSRSPARRMAALGYLGGQPSVETARLLRDYVAWERRPALRRSAQRALRRMEHLLG